ncbi:MAG: rhomboid family intramembrane serine protease [Planctomycetes bacterium]|nr:rhomboid family intramembrane serine protease [Planctomycetota bacterium]
MLLFPVRLKYPYLKPVWAMLVMLFVMAAVFPLEIAGFVEPERWGLMSRANEPWRLMTHMFLHGGFQHLLLNLTFFAVFGQIVNATLGSRLFVAVCLVCGLCSAALELLLDPRLASIPSIGFSGVLMGLVVLGCAWVPRIKVRFVFWFVFMLGFIEFSVWSLAATFLVLDVSAIVFTDWMKEGSAHWGHLGGVVGGLVCFAIVRAFRAAELRGFVVREPKTLLQWSILRRRKRLAPGGVCVLCLHCGFPHTVKERPGAGAELKCVSCGRKGTEFLEGDPSFLRRRRLCGWVLLGCLIAALAAGFLSQRAPHTNRQRAAPAAEHSTSSASAAPKSVSPSPAITPRVK